MRWGFGHQAGLFQLWDRIGAAQSAAMIESAGYTVAPWVREMLAAGCDSFYRIENGDVAGVYDWNSHQYLKIS
jgi:3-hydroxyacyl-CoA dehydrogenase